MADIFQNVKEKVERVAMPLAKGITDHLKIKDRNLTCQRRI